MYRKRHLLLSMSSALVLGLAMPAMAQPAATPVQIEVRASPLRDALMAVAAQTGVQIIFTSEAVAGRSAPALAGRFDSLEAVRRLIVGSDLEARQSTPGVITVRRAATSQAQPLTLSVLDEPTLIDEVVVGSYIRGPNMGASPVTILSREAIDQAGFPTLAEAVAALPQAFGGTANEETLSVGSDATGGNTARASGINLRGLGADATLVLVNGRRLAGSGNRGDFADLSGLPLAAVERVEVLLDGASALYGADAVGGVVNVVLRKSFDGIETRALIGGSTHGDLGQRQFAQTVGRTWDGGGLLASYEFHDRDALPGHARPFTGNADLRALGGTDWRRTFAQPGNIVRPNAVGAVVPAFAIPAGQNGVGLRPGDFLPGQVNLENWRANFDVLSAQSRHSLYLAAHQSVFGLDLSGDIRLSRRRFESRNAGGQATLTVTRANPFFVSPDGAASERISYSFQNELIGGRGAGGPDSLAFTFGVGKDLPRDWRVDFHVAHAGDENTTWNRNMINSSHLSEALGTVADSPLTAYSPGRDGFFNPFIGSGRNAAPVLAHISAGYTRSDILTRVQSANVLAEGPLWTLPGGELRLAVGGQIRSEVFKLTGENFTSGFRPTPTSGRGGRREVSAVFGELRAPLVGADNGRPGLRLLELSAAVRHERHEAVDASTTPKLGVVWSPLEGLQLSGTWGKSFRAPAIFELNDEPAIIPVNLQRNGVTVLSLLQYGGNPDLKPETAESTTLTVRWRPPAVPGLELQASAFDIRYRDRIGQPANDNLATVLSSPEFASFRQFVSPATNAQDLALVNALINSPGSRAQGTFDPREYGAIADARFVNAARLWVRGIDFSATGRMAVAGDPVVLTGQLSWIERFERRMTPTAAAVDLAGLVQNPADLRGRVSAAWTHGALTTTATIRYVSDLRTPSGVGVDSWTTADLNAQWRGPDRGLTRGLTIGLNIQNLFDQDPPFLNSNLGIGYDPANADPFGRQVSLQLTKSW